MDFLFQVFKFAMFCFLLLCIILLIRQCHIVEKRVLKGAENAPTHNPMNCLLYEECNL